MCGSDWGGTWQTWHRSAPLRARPDARPKPAAAFVLTSSQGEKEVQYAFREPWAVPPSLAPKIEQFGLTTHVAQLCDEGYTIVHDAYDSAFCERLREAVIRATSAEQGQYFDIKPGEGASAYHLLGSDPLFAQALLKPQLLALAEYLCGGDFLLSQLACSIRHSGASAMSLHIDSQWIPPTEWNPMFTACLALDDLDEAAGTTKVIPGTHKLLRNPEPEEAVAAQGVPMTCKAGSFAIWTGYAWHANYPRTLPGDRAMLHMTFCRLGYRPVEDYSNLGRDWLAQWPPVMATMLGHDSWMGLAGRDGGACDMNHYMRMWDAARR